MLIDEGDDRFYVANSTLPGAGKGLFTKVPLRKGDRLEVVGVIVRRDSASDRCTHFCDHHKFRIGESRLLVPLGFGGMVNHSPTPNLQKVFDGDRLFLEALRDLQADEEVFFTYTPYAQEAFGLV
jgi:SET domain-containing protein